MSTAIRLIWRLNLVILALEYLYIYSFVFFNRLESEKNKTVLQKKYDTANMSMCPPEII